MAVAALSLCENDNKENIPPFSSKQPISVAVAVFTQSSKGSARPKPKPKPKPKLRPRLRKPLEDITNLVLPQVYYSSSLPQSNTSALPLSSQTNNNETKCRKRRAEDGLETMASICNNKKSTHLAYKSISFR